MAGENKKLIVIDLDGTLTPSKFDLEPEMAGMLVKLLEKKKVAVIGGGGYKQFQNQFIAHLNCPEHLLGNLFLFPTCSTRFFRYENVEWKTVYEQPLSIEEKEKIFEAFE